MKQRALEVDDQNSKTVFWIMFEKLSIILTLVIIFSITLALIYLGGQLVQLLDFL